ncbi:hypothetical protein [Limosilactobacillus vaginalis]|uniref:hypothetical protein n=1 Tax=Limosilactobacillus vaginalis TaxID=1633 RepID=UPI0024BB5CA1|nr:hypothetical protein [Limosilactobacillus vaginalis]
MRHEYRKKTTIKAEQFDGSDEMIKEYGIHEANVPPMVTDLNLYLPTKEGDMVIKQDDWIATGIDGEHWVIANDIFCKAYERCD